jgi:pilus assembly protein Flp/PilA
MKQLINFFKDEEGATMVEYALMVALVAVFLIAAVTVMRGGIDATFRAIGAALNGAL